VQTCALPICIWPLTAFEVAVRRRYAIFSGWYLIFVHSQARRAARFAEHEACFFENFVDTLFLCLGLYLLRSGHYPNFHAFGLALPFYECRYLAQILDAGVRTASDEYVVHRFV